MATSRREPPSDARTNRTARNMSPVLKPTEPGKGLRRARSVPSSPDRKLSPSPTSSSSNPSRPSSSFNARTASSRSTFGSASSSIHGKTLHHPSSMTTAKPANTMRGKTDRYGGTSVWPPALATHNPSSKDMNRAAKSPSTVQMSKLSPRPGVEKMAVTSPKLRTQKGMSGALASGKTQPVPSAHTCGATAKKKKGEANSAPSIQRTSVPAWPIEAPKIEEQEVELLIEFDEMESISTPSIEEHLQERLPDPVELKHVDVIAYVTSQDDPSEPSSYQQEEKNEEVMELTSEKKHEAKDSEYLNGGENADVGYNIEVHAMKEAVNEAHLKETVNETELKEAVDETELNEVVSETGLKEAANETESKEAVVEPELIVKEEAKKKTLELVQGWRKDDGRSNEVKEEGRSKAMEERKSKVMALIGKFETAMSGRE